MVAVTLIAVTVTIRAWTREIGATTPRIAIDPRTAIAAPIIIIGTTASRTNRTIGTIVTMTTIAMVTVPAVDARFRSPAGTQ